MSACRFCSATVFWRYVDGRATPYDFEDKPHSCGAKAKNSRPAQFGGPRPGKPVHVNGGKTVGEQYEDVKHLPGCYTLPWVACECPELVRWRERVGIAA